MPLYGVVVAPFVTVTSTVPVLSALTSANVIALPAVGRPVGDGVTVTVAVGDGEAVTVTVGDGASVSVGITINGWDGVGVGVGAFDAVAAAAGAAVGTAGGVSAGWNGLRPTAAVYAAGTAWTAEGLADAIADVCTCGATVAAAGLDDDPPENSSK